MLNFFKSHSKNEMPNIFKISKPEAKNLKQEVGNENSELTQIRYGLITNPDFGNLPMEAIERMANEEYKRRHES